MLVLIVLMIEQKLLEKNILEVRKFPNLTHKEQMQINAKKYTEVFRLAKESKNPEIVFRNPDWFVELCKSFHDIQTVWF